MSKGRFGEFGGQYISETLMNELIRLEECYEYYKKDKEFQEELDRLLKEYARCQEHAAHQTVDTVLRPQRPQGHPPLTCQQRDAAPVSYTHLDVYKRQI